jgi:hypothetical protein
LGDEDRSGIAATVPSTFRATAEIRFRVRIRLTGTLDDSTFVGQDSSRTGIRDRDRGSISGANSALGDLFIFTVNIFTADCTPPGVRSGRSFLKKKWSNTAGGTKIKRTGLSLPSLLTKGGLYLRRFMVIKAVTTLWVGSPRSL